MCFQMSLTSKRLITHITGVWTITTMYVLMYLCTTVFTECFISITSLLTNLVMYKLTFIQSTPLKEREKWTKNEYKASYLIITRHNTCILDYTLEIWCIVYCKLSQVNVVREI